MAYGLKYTSGNITRNGEVYELRILQRDYSGDVYEIGDIQELGVEIQGGSGGIDQPVIKTLLHFTVVDSVDMGVVDGVKHGGWEEFYTPDSTLYKVRLLRGGVIIWAGAITPDSWSDSLVYRGSITVTARDNVGHMADFEFSKDVLLTWMSYLGGEVYNRVLNENLVSIYELAFAAFNVAGVDMPLRHRWDEDDANREPHLKAGTYDVLDWLIDIDALQELNWYEAVEKVLASAGLALRWCGKDGICVMNLRALHKMGQAEPPVRNVNFINRSGHRTLDPAYKQIVEKLNYDPVEGFEAQWTAEDFTLTDRGYSQQVSAINKDKWTQNDLTKEVLRFLIAERINYWGDVSGKEDRYLLLASSNSSGTVTSYVDSANYVQYEQRISPATIVSVGFELAHSYMIFDPRMRGINLPRGTFRYAILWKKLDGTYLSYNDEVWEEGEIVQTWDNTTAASGRRPDVDPGIYSDVPVMTFSQNLETPDVPGRLVLRFYPYIQTDTTVTTPIYIRLGDITYDVNTEAIPRYFKTTTVYDPVQNKTLKRDVDFGAVPTRFKTAGTIRNGFYKPDAANGFPSIMDCHWDGDSTELPLPVLNHLQILSLHAKANSVLTGELRDANGLAIRPDAVWHYAGRTFLLQAGTWNIFSDRIQNAILREYDTYEVAIGSIVADYTTDLSGGDARLLALQKSVNAAASLAKNSGGSGGGGGGGETGTVTSVALSMPTYFDVTGSPVTGSGTLTASLKSTYKLPSTSEWSNVSGKAHEHSNKSILDLFDQGYINSIDAAISASHTHSNKTVLNGITSTKVSHWDAAYDAISSLPDIDAQDIEHWDDAAALAHSHDNLAALNGITSTKVSNWDDAATNSHSHSNKSVLDGITSAKVADWDDAVTKAHSHSNKSVLDGITSAKVTNWDDAVTKAHSHSNKSVLDGITSAKVSAWDDAAAAAASIDVGIGGTDAAPTVEVELGSGASDSAALPVASASKAGIVSTAAQAFAGAKTFGTIYVDRIYIGPSAYLEWDSSAGAVKLVGDFYATDGITAGD